MKIKKFITVSLSIFMTAFNMPLISSYAITNKVTSHIYKIENIDFDSYARYTVNYNNGFKRTDRVQEKADTSGNVYAFCGDKDIVYLVPENPDINTISFEKNGFTFGAATIGADNNIYIMWGRDFQKGNTADKNISVCKYDINGNFIASLDLPVDYTMAEYPFASGNANINYKNGVLGILFDTKWTSMHQGAEFIAIRAEDMTLIDFNDWQGSHSLGVSMLDTDFGFEAVQMGDVYPRGININRYSVDDGGNFNFDNGNIVVFHVSGCYGTNESQLDGNTTYTHLGGFAKSGETYALAGKSERVYTSEAFYNSQIRTRKFDVFVRFFDNTFEKSDKITVGEDRIDVSTGEVVDTNIVWLSECDYIVETGDVKIVTLESGNYCILWEEFIDGKYDNIHYIITDRYGNTVREESQIEGAYLSTTSVQPIVQGNELVWAVADSDKSSLIWYRVNLDETTEDFILGDVNSDGKVNSADASMALSEYASVSTGHGSVFSENQRKCADINGDDIVDAYDASRILEFYTYLSTGGGKTNMKEWLALD